MDPNTKEKLQKAYSLYRDLIYKNAYCYIKDFHLAQDICQETFLKLERYVGVLPEAQLKPWLLLTSANHAKDLLRKGGKYGEQIVSPLEVPGAFAESYELEDMVLGRLEINRLLERLRMKNRNWYEALMLTKYFGLSVAETAVLMETTEGSVKNMCRRGKHWLQREYGKEKEEL